MRKLVMLIGSFLLLLVGCSNEAYEQAMSEGVAALEKEDYAKAKASFARALEEKADDEEAKVLLKQTEYIQEAVEKMENGDLDTAADAAQMVIDLEDESTLLVELAKEIQEEIEIYKEKYKEYIASYEEAKKQYDSEEYDDAIVILEAVLEEEMEHTFFEQVKLDFEDLLEEVKAAKEEAILAAEEEEKRKVEEEAKQKQEEEQKASAQGIGELAGYWLNKENNIACHITSSYMHCAMPYSDFITHHEISDITHINATEVEITIPGEAPFILKLSDNNGTLHTPAYAYQRVSKEEANAIFDGHYELQ